MNLYIDNNDGLGGVDYTAAVLAEQPLTIVRERGAWTRCTCGLDVTGTGLPVPQSKARVLVTDASGDALFQGFLSADARAMLARAALPRVDDEPDLIALETAWLTQETPSDVLSPPTSTVHTAALNDVAVTYQTPSAGEVADLASDVTVSGENEATTYVTELFRGDGTTNVFTLAHAPFRAPGLGVMIDDSFDDVLLNATSWSKMDTGSYLRLGAGGLVMSGGTGFDGGTVLRYQRPLELAGTLMAEVTGLTLTTGSEGVVLGFYNGLVQQSSCIAGVKVRGVGGAHQMVALVNGVEQPVPYDFTDGHAYTVRIRAHCAEMTRIPASYTALVDGVPQTFTSDPKDASIRVVIEVVDAGLASSTLPMVLYDGALAVSPYECVFAPVNSVSLVGSMARVALEQQGSAWVVSTATDGSRRTRREGPTGSGADFSLTSSGTMTFAPGLVPQPGELVTVSYRRSRRAVARRRDADADAVRVSLGLPGLPAWNGHVLQPKARTSADCTTAAEALLALARGSATGRSGKAEWVRETAIAADVMPGDSLSMGTTVLPLHSVTITDGNCLPEVLRYRAAFGQSRSDSLSFTLGAGLAEDAAKPASLTAYASGPTALSGLQVTSVTDTVLTVDAGADPPVGGGFEVRRSEANFGTTVTSDLVLQSPVRSFSVPRTAFAERLFVRMYDGADPPAYAAVSSVVLTHLPVG